LHSQVQELLSTDAPLSKDTLSKAGSVLNDRAVALAADAAAAASNSDTAAAALQEQIATAQRQRDDAVAELETTAAAMTKLQAAAATAQQEEATAATQPADELGSAVHELLLDLGKTLGVGTSLPDEVCTH
jgi:chromosome segregation ATPase